MWPRPWHSPLKLAVFAVAGLALYTLTLLVAALLSHRGAPWIFAFNVGLAPWFLSFPIALAIFLPGIVIELRAVSLLREGIRVERWRQEELDALRTQVEKPVWRVVTWMFFALMVVLIFFLPRRSVFSNAWLFLWLHMNLQMVLRRPISPVRQTIDWATVKPLQSDHWGEQYQRISRRQNF